MDLWHKALVDVDYGDILAFCQSKLPESTRLDYKRDFTDKLEALICAFANTYGGLILIGIDSDKKDDTPIWPPAGIDLTSGMELRVHQIAAEAIYPPLPVEVSRPISVQGTTDKYLLVVRVEASPLAPHAIEK